MAVSVPRVLELQVQEDANAVKLTDKQQDVCGANQKGQPKCLGASQIMLGLMIMSYSIPLHFTEFTQVVFLGVPWWSGLVFIIAGVVAVILDKRCTTWTYRMSMMVNVVSVVLSIVAVIIYSVDLDKNPEFPCERSIHHNVCSERFYATRLSRGLKSFLLLFTLAQTAVCATLCILLYRHKRTIGLYAPFPGSASSPPRVLITPDQC
ncbi:transmembrane protein 176 [Nerophis lumbriciformis]|uniref:transmembrane protein 176 n=1 Tax=Nerophis lumbriciformis TaxID=546530 RepID=UPI002ADF530A|nr:membrane-spanning 4-domains subfamily A member 12-like [Nerophis lumbriciformis]